MSAKIALGIAALLLLGSKKGATAPPTVTTADVPKDPDVLAGIEVTDGQGNRAGNFDPGTEHLDYMTAPAPHADPLERAAGVATERATVAPVAVPMIAPLPGKSLEITAADGSRQVVTNDGIGVTHEQASPAPVSKAAAGECMTCKTRDAATISAVAKADVAHVINTGDASPPAPLPIVAPKKPGTAQYNVRKAPDPATQSKNLLTLGPKVGAIW